MNLLTRDQFREAVFKRDKHKCVVCGLPAVDAHHIMERKLFQDGGYYLNNGASLCSGCHLKAETTEISVEYLCTCCGIKEVLLPTGFDPGKEYDKWGNEILPNGSRLRGPLFEDKSVQRALGKRLSLFEEQQ